MALKTVAALLGVIAVCSSTSVDSALQVTIVEHLVHHFHCGCAVLFRQGYGKDEAEILVSLQKYLAMREIVTAVTHLMDLHLPEDWPICRPVRALAIVKGNSKTISIFLQQVSPFLQMVSAVWLILLDSGSLEDALDGVVTGLDCEMLVAEIQGENVLITEVYRISSLLHKIHFGSWTPEQGLHMLPLQGFYERRQDLHGDTIRIAAINKYPMSGTKLKENGALVLNENTYYGQLWKVIEKKLNITTNVVKARDDAIGSKLSNGSWTGVLAMIKHNEVDIGVSDFVMATMRLGFLDFSEPLYQSSLALFVNPNDAREVNWNSFLDPFSPRLWFAALGTILVLSLSVALFYEIVGQYTDSEDNTRFLDLLLFMYGIFCQQGVEKSPDRTSFRMLYLTAYITSIMLLSSYSAALISSLSTRKTQLPFSSLYDLLNLGDFRLGIVVNSWVYNQLSTTGDKKIVEVRDALVEPYLDEMPNSVIEGLQWLCDPDLRYAFYGFIQDVISVMTMVNCTPAAVSGDRSRISLAMAIRKQYMYRGIINHRNFKLIQKVLKTMLSNTGSVDCITLSHTLSQCLREMRCSGVLKRLMKNAYRMKMPEPKSMMERLDIWDVTPLMSILAVGTFVGTLFLWLERAARNLMHKQSLKRRLLPRRHLMRKFNTLRVSRIMNEHDKQRGGYLAYT